MKANRQTGAASYFCPTTDKLLNMGATENHLDPPKLNLRKLTNHREKSHNTAELLGDTWVYHEGGQSEVLSPGPGQSRSV